MARAALIAVLLASAACGGPRAAVVRAVEQRDVEGALQAYERFREGDATDPRLLGEIAALSLELEALEGSEPSAAILQLRLAGTASEGALRRIARDAGSARVRAEALDVLASRGDEDARALLYGLLDSDDAEVVALAIGAMEVQEDAERLVSFLAHEDAGVRRAAALRLGASQDALALNALLDLARVDSDASVRGAAVQALGGFGADAMGALDDRMSDPESSVRMAAVRSIVRADRENAGDHLRPLLETPPNNVGIEAARVIASVEASGVPLARAYLVRVLREGDATLRAQAAVALVAIPRQPNTDTILLALMRSETDAMVRFGIARALQGEFPTEAKAALRALMQGEGMPGLQSAVILAEEHEEAALRVLEATAADGAHSLLRRVAVRALAREAQRPDLVRPYLRDADVLVRIHAAGGMLAAASAS